MLHFNFTFADRLLGYDSTMEALEHVSLFAVDSILLYPTPLYPSGEKKKNISMSTVNH